MFRNACQNYFPKRIAKNVSQSSSLKRLCKAVTSKQLHQSGHVSNLFPKAATQSYSPKRLPKPLHKVVAESCSPKFRSKANSQNCGSLKLLFKAAVQSCGAKLLFKAAPASQSCSAKLLPKAVPCSCFPEVMPKAPPQSECPQSYYASNVFPKAVPLQSGSQKLLRKVTTDNCPPKLHSKASRQSCSPRLRFFKAFARSCKVAPAPQRCFHKAVPQSWYRKLFRIVASQFYKPKSCYWKLLPEVVCRVAPESYCSSK